MSAPKGSISHSLVCCSDQSYNWSRRTGDAPSNTAHYLKRRQQRDKMAEKAGPSTERERDSRRSSYIVSTGGAGSPASIPITYLTHYRPDPEHARRLSATQRPKKKKKRRKKDQRPWRERLMFQLKFITMCVGFSMGLGNVWRFPYLCYKNGGGAFLVPYALILLLAGIPLLAMEMILGQYSGLGPVQIFRHMCPIFQGLGYAMMLVSILTAIFYNTVFAWTLCYLFLALSEDLPWQPCGKSWNDEYCYTYKKVKECMANGTVYYNNDCISTHEYCRKSKLGAMVPRNITHCYDPRFPNGSDVDVMNATVFFNFRMASEQYLRTNILKMSKTIDVIFPFDKKLIFWLCVSWIVVFIKMVFRFYTKGYMLYFTTFFPYAMFLLIFVRIIFLDGLIEGLEYYIVPNFTQVTNLDIWGEAASQICFSLGPGFGIVISIASFWRFDMDCIRNAFIIGFMDTASSILGGIITFGILGFLVKNTRIHIKKIVTEGTWLAFTAFPEAVNELEIPRLWAILFYVFMVVSLGVDQQFDTMESLMIALVDEYPNLRKHRTMIIFICCLAFCALGIVFTGKNGPYMFRLFDEYITGWILVFLCLIECVVVFGVYNYSHGRDRQRFYEDYIEMFGKEPTPYWRSCWKIWCPLTLVMVIIFAWFFDEPPPFGGTYVFPEWSTNTGKVISSTPIFVVIGFAIYRAIMTARSDQPWKSLITPTENWKSAKERGRKEDLFPDLVDYI